MAREIRKKVIDADTLAQVGTGGAPAEEAPDSFDEQLFDQLGKEFDQISTFGGGTEATMFPEIPEAPKGGPAPLRTLSLDDFSTSFGDDTGLESHEAVQAEVIRKKEAREPPSSMEEEASSAPAKKGLGRFLPDRKYIIWGAAGILLFAALTAAVVSFIQRDVSHEKAGRNEVIRHPVTVTYQKVQFEFLMLAVSEQERNLVALGLELKFPALNSYEDFQKKSLFYKDEIYRFMLKARPARNSYRYWQEIVENDLMTHLKGGFTGIGIHSIYISHLDRL